MPTRADLEALVYRDFSYASSPASAVSTRVQSYLNDRHRRILLRPGMEKLRYKTLSVTLTASTATYALQMPIQRILKVVDTTNKRVLEERTLDWYRRAEPSPSTGTQEYWIKLGRTPALSEPAGTGLWAVSSSASDTTQTVHVETIDTNGSATSATVALNGVTRAQLGTATNHQRITRFTMTAVGAGVVSLYNASSSGTEVANIQLGRTSADNLLIALWPTPAAADTIQIDYVHFIRDFTVSYDEPQLPYDFHYLVAVGAKIDEARHKNDDRWNQWQREWDEGLRLLEDWLCNDPDMIVIPGSLDTQGKSNLGSAYPAGIWALLISFGLSLVSYVI